MRLEHIVEVGQRAYEFISVFSKTLIGVLAHIKELRYDVIVVDFGRPFRAILQLVEIVRFICWGLVWDFDIDRGALTGARVCKLFVYSSEHQLPIDLELHEAVKFIIRRVGGLGNHDIAKQD